ncbi:alpha/beta fold hydrolase [Aerophototrophica crusticola]|uniref:alpha/beta fold hydrolase n=1 Tax=Aerophototrophica crusticola TaxID=1709002 RepID=UPI00384EB620
MDSIQGKFVEANGIRIHYLELGEGPPVLLCHGWPELAYSWRRQMKPLAQAGYRVVAPDMRGFGLTDAPDDLYAYGMLHKVGDMVALVGALGADSAVVVGHDWGAPVAWHCALYRPDLFRGVAGLSVPYSPRGSQSLPSLLGKMGLTRFYMMYFQEPGVAEADLERDPYQVQRRLLVGASGYGVKHGKSWPAIIPPGMGLLDASPEADTLPDWLSEEDLDTYGKTYARTGYRGGLNWYRNMDRDWELNAPWAGAPSPSPPASSPAPWTA